jgi:hypothetical protein
VFSCFRLIAVEFAGSPMHSIDRKPLNMGIAGVEPCQLAPTVGTTGSGSTDSPAPPPTNTKIEINPAIDATAVIAVPAIIDTDDKININPAINAAVVIAVLAVIDTDDKIDINPTIDAAAIIAMPAVIDTDAKIDINPTIDATAIIAVPAIIKTNAKIDINPTIDATAIIAVPAVIDIDDKIDIDLAIDTAIGLAVLGFIGTTSLKPEDNIAGMTITVPAITGGFDMAFGLFNFHVNNDRVAELISIGDLIPPVMALTTSPVAEGNPLVTTLWMPLEEEPRPKDSTPSVGSNNFEAPPPSPTTGYCTDCDAYHFVGAGDFLSHEIAGCEDPRGGTAAVYSMISECKRALNALTLRTMPYNPDYVEGLYSDYTCLDDDDIYPEAKGKIGNSDSLYSSSSTTSSNEYMVDYDSDLTIEVKSYLRDDDTYPPALGEISDDSIPQFGGHCMMVSHGDGNKNRANDSQNQSNTGR